MPWTAQLDTTKTPPVVIAVYDFTDPTWTPPVYIDVTNVQPRVVPGCTYASATQTWTYPPVPEDLLAWAQQAIVANNAFIAIKNPGSQQINAQLDALTWQWTRILSRRIGGI